MCSLVLSANRGKIAIQGIGTYGVFSLRTFLCSFLLPALLLFLVHGSFLSCSSGPALYLSFRNVPYRMRWSVGEICGVFTAARNWRGGWLLGLDIGRRGCLFGSCGGYSIGLLTGSFCLRLARHDARGVSVPEQTAVTARADGLTVSCYGMYS